MENEEPQEEKELLIIHDTPKTCSICFKTGKSYINEKGDILCDECFIDKKQMYINAFLQQTFLHLSYDEINEWIILGNEDCAKDQNFLDNNGITHILICAEGCEVFFEGKYKYKILYLDDAPDENILIWFKEAFDFINEAINNKGKVYVHCAMGISRSASVVIGYLMYVNKLTYDDAFEFVYNKRKQICPNKGFVKQLQEFEEMLIKVNYTDNVFNIINQDIQEE